MTASTIPTNALSVEAQTKNITFSVSKNNPTVFIPRNVGGALGATPQVMTKWCKITPHGKKDDNLRGVVSYTSQNGNTFNRLKLGLGNDSAADVFELCRRVHNAFKEEYSPVGKSMWWQKKFNFLDGTKVFDGTEAVVDPELYAEFTFDGEDMYNAPSKTFADALYGRATDSMWYTSVSVPTYGNRSSGNVLALFDADCKPIKTKYDGSTEIYKTGGIAVENHDAINIISNSKFFKTNTWTCRTTLQLSSLEWKSAINTSSGKRVVYPIFHLKTFGSIYMKITPYVLPDGVVSVDKRAEFINALLHEGMGGPVKKRKNKAKAASKNKRAVNRTTPPSTPDSDLEIIIASDIEGDEEEY